ncbi:OmpA family protein [Salinisphaera sp. RV14]|uniref:OmpA family protein n=1 Tax=Salinisphaera sp. RV14 TaxID=3454140 RepID=UPI003F87361E
MERSRTYRGRRWRGIVGLAVVLSVLAVVAGPPCNAAASQPVLDLPVSMPASARTLASTRSKKTYPLIVGRIVQLGGIPGNISAVRTVDGTAMRRTFVVPGAGSAKALAATLAQRLTQAGFEPLFSCHGATCGPHFQKVSPGYRAAPAHFDGPLAGQVYRAMRRPSASGDEYVALQIAPDDAGLAVQFDVARSQPREVGAISVDAAEMARQLTQAGHVALHGIFFGTDSDRIKPESRSMVAQIAKLLENKPKLRLLVVGHTDNRGSFAYNQALSERRAKAVVQALVQQHGIDPARLKPVGVSYAAPSASNATAAGRAKNRRVELVPW